MPQTITNISFSFHKPCVKWVGSKWRVLRYILPNLPPSECYIEPFAGGATVFLNTAYNRNILAEINPDLINFYQHLQREGPRFIRYLQRFFQSHTNQKAYYLALREEFNHARLSQRRRAALFYYLNRHGFNGLCRYNRSGELNVPFGRYQRVTLPTAALLHFHQKSQTAEIRLQDFCQTLQQAPPGAIVYCDPPYVPLSPTAMFTHYHTQGFHETEQIQLARLAEQQAENGVTVLISNHDTPWVRELYQNAIISSFTIPRFISSDTKNRKPVQELLAVFARQ